MKEKLKAELDRMTKLGAINPVHEPTDWVTLLMTVKRPNGNLRVCIDPLPSQESHQVATL